MRHGDVSYVDEAGAPVRPEDVPLTPRGREQATAARAALANVEFDLVVASDLPARGRRPSRCPGSRGRALAGALGVARRPTRRDPARRARGSVRRRAAGPGRSSALPRRRVARRGARPCPSRAGAAARTRVGHRSCRPSRRRQPDRDLLRALRGPHVLRHVRQAPECINVLDLGDDGWIYGRQRRPLRPAPPRSDDDAGAPLGAAEAVSRRAPVAPPPPRGADTSRGSPSGAQPLLVEAGCSERGEPWAEQLRPDPDRKRVPEKGHDVISGSPKDGCGRSRGGRGPRRGCCGGGSRRGRARRGEASCPASSSSALARSSPSPSSSQRGS